MTDEIEIIDYTSAHQPLFKSLNLEWLDAYHLTESHDLMVLDDPQKTILEQSLLCSPSLMLSSRNCWQAMDCTLRELRQH